VGLLRLELDIDADVYPELHATLTSLAGDASRGERLRQLAAAGLVWEKLRIRGQAALHGVAESVPGSAMPPMPAPAPAQATRAARGAATRAPAAASRSPAPPPATPPRSAPPGFVDLALDAEPAPLPPPVPLPMPLPSPVPVPKEMTQQAAPAVAGAAPWPPVLMDVVDPQSYVTAVPIAMAENRPSRPMPLAPPSPARSRPDMRDDSAPDPDPDPVPEPPVEHRSSTRSRLQRMKEKGLFRNG
jgi:hypothetical protein